MSSLGRGSGLGSTRGCVDGGPVSWHDRDWARWTDEERRRFYGAAPSGAPSRARRSLHPSGLWTVLATLIVSVLGFAGYANRPWSAAAAPSAALVVYGDQAVPAAGEPVPAPMAPGGRRTVCTDEVERGGAWTCMTYAVLMQDQSAAQAAPPPVPCTTERVVDQSLGRWVCTGSKFA